MTDSTTPGPSPEQVEARAQLDAIHNDRSHAYNVGGKGYPEAEARVLEFNRIALGSENVTHEVLREEGDRPMLDAAPPAPTVTWADFKQLAPSEMARPDVTRFQTVATELGATVYEDMRLLNLTRSAPPAEEDTPDFSEYWGADWRAKAERVGALLRAIKAKAPDFYERLAPYVTRRTDVADHVLAVAERLAGHAPRLAPPPRPTPPAEPVDRAESRYPFVWAPEERR